MESILSNTSYLESSSLVGEGGEPEDAEDRELDGADETTDHDMVEVSAPNDVEDSAAKEEEAKKKTPVWKKKPEKKKKKAAGGKPKQKQKSKPQQQKTDAATARYWWSGE